MSILSEIDHRPWPLPARPWVMRQNWHDLLFAHWPVAPQVVRELLPSEIELDTFEGEAWVGVVPFRMSGVRLRALPPMPGAGSFPELNLRTYATLDGKPGVWFFCLEATSRIAVAVARGWFHLPYHRARMSCTSEGDRVRHSSVRTQAGAGEAEFAAIYGPTGNVYSSRKGTLEDWLTERYCLYAADAKGNVWRGDIHHRPWPLQPASASIEKNTLARAHGFALPDRDPLLHFARRLDVWIWAPRRA